MKKIILFFLVFSSLFSSESKVPSLLSMTRKAVARTLLFSRDKNISNEYTRKLNSQFLPDELVEQVYAENCESLQDLYNIGFNLRNIFSNLDSESIESFLRSKSEQISRLSVTFSNVSSFRLNQEYLATLGDKFNVFKSGTLKSEMPSFKYASSVLNSVGDIIFEYGDAVKFYNRKTNEIIILDDLYGLEFCADGSFAIAIRLKKGPYSRANTKEYFLIFDKSESQFNKVKIKLKSKDSLDISENGQTIAALDEKDNLCIYNTKGKRIHKIDFSNQKIKSFRLSKDGKEVFVIEQNNDFNVYNLNGEVKFYEVARENCEYTFIDSTASADIVLLYAKFNNFTSFDDWRKNRALALQKSRTLPQANKFVISDKDGSFECEGSIQGSSFNLDKRILAISNENSIKIYKFGQTLDLIQELNGYSSAKISKNGKFVLALSKNVLTLFDGNGNKIRDFIGDYKQFDLSSDGTLVFALDYTSKLNVFYNCSVSLLQLIDNFSQSQKINFYGKFIKFESYFRKILGDSAYALLSKLLKERMLVGLSNSSLKELIASYEQCSKFQQEFMKALGQDAYFSIWIKFLKELSVDRPGTLGNN